MAKPKTRVFGIDLGTTYSSIAMVGDFGKPMLIPNAENERTTPSCVFFDGEHVIVGAVAKESSRLYPDSVVSFVKRSMGEMDFNFFHEGKVYRCEEISAYVLKKLVQDACATTGEDISDVVITCPAYFGINEREATRRAGEIAGLTVRQIINEPTAAAISYGVTDTTEDRVVLVYDLGGGTFDITMIHIQPEAIEVICTGGDHNLGGKDWDDRIVAHLVEEFANQTGIRDDILDDPLTWQDLQISAERMKKILSQREVSATAVTYGGQRAKVELSRKRFEEITSDLLERTIMLTRSMLGEAEKKGYKSFHEFLLVGGSARMPQVQARITKEFAIEPRIYDPDEAVAKGAAIFGWKQAINDKLVARIAAKVKKPKEEVAKKLDVKSREFVEAASELEKEEGYTLPAIKSSVMQIVDVTSKSFGVFATNKKGVDGVFNLVVKNTRVPVNADKDFYTAVDDQDSVHIRIMESEDTDSWVDLSSCVEIGSAVLYLPAGLPKDSPIDITFSLNREGRLEITAKERTKGRKVAAVVETRSVISGRELAEAKERCQRLRVH
ncbi:MAG: Hsp70 family protein [Thermodesulfobacteriota bacterium]